MIHKLAADPPWPGNMKLRVRSDGTAEGTYVFAVDSLGAEYPVEAVTGVTWRIDITHGDMIATATVSILAAPADLEAELAPEIVLERAELE